MAAKITPILAATPRSMIKMRRHTLAPKIASFMFVWGIICRYCPAEVRRYLKSYIRTLITDFFTPYIQISIHEFNGSNLNRSEAYTAVQAYLSVTSASINKKFKAVVGKEKNKLLLQMDEHESVTDEFNGVKVWWYLSKLVSNSEVAKRCYRLMFHKKHKEIITGAYLEHVIKKGREITRMNMSRRLYTNSSSIFRYPLKTWSHIVFNHPATFECIAMEAEKKQEIIEDLLTFTKSKDYYARIGKPWKRGYLLYGPPGTGKSTMIAAMANLLNYNIYDLELTAVKDNTELRKLLIETTSKSILVIEDIDCSLKLTGQRKTIKKDSLDNDKQEGPSNEPNDSKVTLSGLLNMIDGLWSTSGGERIIVFTTNFVEKLDPALTRRGRMDKHIEMSYCSFEGFKVLAKNYLEVEEHPMFDVIQQLMEKTNITPADVAENLMRRTTNKDVDVCLSDLIQALKECKEDLEN